MRAIKSTIDPMNLFNPGKVSINSFINLYYLLSLQSSTLMKERISKILIKLWDELLWSVLMLILMIMRSLFCKQLQKEYLLTVLLV